MKKKMKLFQLQAIKPVCGHCNEAVTTVILNETSNSFNNN